MFKQHVPPHSLTQKLALATRRSDEQKKPVKGGKKLHLGRRACSLHDKIPVIRLVL